MPCLEGALLLLQEGTLPPAYITEETKAQNGTELWVFGVLGPGLGSMELMVILV